jgi:hypothetical protein
MLHRADWQMAIDVQKSRGAFIFWVESWLLDRQIKVLKWFEISMKITILQV